MGNTASVTAPAPGRGTGQKAVLRESGGLVFHDNVEPPVLSGKEGELLVKIRAAAINPVDYKAPKIILGPVAGLDFAGEVEAVGAGGGHGFVVGDRVYGTVRGSLAERAVCFAAAVSYVPEGLSMTEAAAMPTAHLTSYQALTNYGNLREGGRVLVIGASGGTGTAALQLARQMNAGEVVAVCSGKNAEYAMRNGATRVVDYTQENLPEVFANAKEEEKFDVIYDCATASGGGEDYHGVSQPLLCSDGGDGRRHGQYVAINGAPSMWIRKFCGVGQKANQHLFLTNANTADLAHLAK